MRIYNTLTNSIEELKTIEEKKLKLYVCGPTVYSNVHMGNVRTFMSFDFIYRTLVFLGYKVRYVRNITDAGHLTDDGNIDNDKIRLIFPEVNRFTCEKVEVLMIHIGGYPGKYSPLAKENSSVHCNRGGVTFFVSLLYL